ncbi:hypothetical protein [uncultured Clostridium sp.]|uniref:hypothetical protein n=1 Tax=uncultured Clostridium sp. TaxID=59620 RepID=UPI002610F74F|nr:hypothetical protein [uncultured Clostridium sp.]
MRISPKRTVVNLKYIELKGDILDVSLDDTGVIYNLIKSKNNEDISLSYLKDSKDEEGKFDCCTLFFSLGTLSKGDSKVLIQDISKLIKFDGELYLWDRIKVKNEIIRDNVIVKMPDETDKKFQLMNLNPFYEFNDSRCRELLKNNFMIIETLIWDNVIYIKAKKI